MNKFVFQAEPSDAGKRADVFLSGRLPGLSRSYIQKLIKDGALTVDDASVEKAGFKMEEGMTVSFQVPESSEPEIAAEDIPLDIIYEDDDILIVNKPKDMVVHPSAGHEQGTLVNALLHHCGDSLSGINGVTRPGIVHRIDKDTTGSLIICKNDLAHASLSEQLSVHSIKRKYRAIVHGRLKEEHLTINEPVGRHPVDRKKMAVNHKNGKEARTEVTVLRELKGFTYVECELFTGRTHQIRVHMASIGHPVLGDEIYGPKKCPVKGLTGQTLHAYLIGFVHPRTGEYMEFTAPLPDYFSELLDRLKVDFI